MIRSLHEKKLLPKDDQIISQLQKSFSKACGNVASGISSSAAFVTLKRRQLLLSHVVPSVSDAQKRNLLSDPFFQTGSLFSSSSVEPARSAARDLSLFMPHLKASSSTTPACRLGYSSSAAQRGPARSSSAQSFHAVCFRSLQGFQRLIFLLLFALLLLPPLRVSLALPLRCPGLVRILVSLQFAPGFFSGLFSSSFLRCSCCLRCGSLCFPSASASSFIAFVGSTPQPGYAQAYAPLSGTSTTPSVLLSQCLVRVLLSFGWGLWLRSIPVLWLRFLRLSFLPFACLRLRWCLP